MLRLLYGGYQATKVYFIGIDDEKRTIKCISCRAQCRVSKHGADGEELPAVARQRRNKQKQPQADDGGEETKCAVEGDSEVAIAVAVGNGAAEDSQLFSALYQWQQAIALTEDGEKGAVIPAAALGDWQVQGGEEAVKEGIGRNDIREKDERRQRVIDGQEEKQPLAPASEIGRLQIIHDGDDDFRRVLGNQDLHAMDEELQNIGIHSARFDMGNQGFFDHFFSVCFLLILKIRLSINTAAKYFLTKVTNVSNSIKYHLKIEIIAKVYTNQVGL